MNNALLEKWESVLNHKDAAPITDIHRRNVTAQLLENTAQDCLEQASILNEADVPVNIQGSGIANFDPIMISLVRRAAPALVAYDIASVQPMTGPTGIIFAMRSRYTNQSGDEALYNEPNTSFSSVVSGANTFGQKHVGTTPTGVVNTYNTGSAMSTAQAEALGSASNAAFAELAFTIEKVTVTAKTRALASGYTQETAQDLKKVHGLSADAEISNMLVSEILGEINRELVRTINITAVPGAQAGTAVAGTFNLDTDSNGRWLLEKFQGLRFFLDIEANKISKDTRRGKGNFILCSSNVASALSSSGLLTNTPGMNGTNLAVSDVGVTFAGILNNVFKVYIDPFATGDYFTMGYKGVANYDAGITYAPYIPLQKMTAIVPETMTPRIAYKTRYGLVANPYAQGTTAGVGALTLDSNLYYRRTLVTNII